VAPLSRFPKRQEARFRHDDEARGGRQCVERQQAEARRTVHQRDVIADHVDQLPSKNELISHRAPRLPRRERSLRRREIETPVRSDDDITQREPLLLEQHVSDRVPLLHVDTEDLRRRRLRIKVD
jgi:hypothetical protein